MTTVGNSRYIEGGLTSPAKLKVIGRFLNTSEDKRELSKHFGTPSTTTRTLVKITEDCRRVPMISET